MSIPIQLVFDTNILVDCLLARGPYYAYGVQLLDKVAARHIEGWYAPHSITTVYYLAERTLAREARNRAQSETTARELVKVLVTTLKPLPQIGDEILHLSSEPGNDYEDEVISYLASSYLPNALIVTRDKWFLQRDGIQAAHPKEIIESEFKPWLPANARVEFIDLAAQQRQILPAIQRKIQRVLGHGQYIMGPEVAEMEQKLAAYTGARHCISCASGTEALLISLMALGIGPGDEVITSPFTFAATAEMIVLAGAKPVYVDIERDTCLMDAAQLEAKITARTKAIMPVSLYGQVADMNAINAIAARHGNIPVIEDAAQSFGASYNGRKSCNLSTIGCTSFFPSKPLGCYGDGGAVFTNDDMLAKAMREIRVHGQERRYYHTRIGVGGRMDTIQCAIVLAKLERFDWEIGRRLMLGDQYREQITGSGARLGLLAVRPDRNCVWAQYTVFVEHREAVQKALLAQGIPTAVHYPLSLNRQPVYRDDDSAAETPNSHWAAQRVMSLPMSADLTGEQMARVVAALKLES